MSYGAEAAAAGYAGTGVAPGASAGFALIGVLFIRRGK